MANLGKTMLNIVLMTCAGKDMLNGLPVTFSIGELDAIICKNGMDTPILDKGLS